MTKLKHYLWLASINLFISTFTFGGGYVVVPMIRKYYVLNCQIKCNTLLKKTS
ncbi:hypothetical protein ACWOE8_12685 [Enterococcus avium]